jgi:hypothetical protein
MLMWCCGLISRWTTAAMRTSTCTSRCTNAQPKPSRIGKCPARVELSLSNRSPSPSGPRPVQVAAPDNEKPQLGIHKAALSCDSCRQRASSACSSSDTSLQPCTHSSSSPSVPYDSTPCRAMPCDQRASRGSSWFQLQRTAVVCTERWTSVARSAAHWRGRVACVLLTDLATMALPVYLHFLTLRRMISVMGWPSVLLSPGLGWLLPLCAALLALAGRSQPGAPLKDEPAQY